MRLPVDVDALVDQVVVAPRANASFVEHVRKSVEARFAGKAIQQSSLQFNKVASDNCRRYIEAEKLLAKVMREHKINPQQYVVFDNKEKFDEWSSRVNRALGFPVLGRRASDGRIAIDACGSANWSNAISHPGPGDQRVITIATASIAFGHKLISDAECRKLGWFG